MDRAGILDKEGDVQRLDFKYLCRTVSQQPCEQQEKQGNQLFPLAFWVVPGVSAGCDSCSKCFSEECFFITSLKEELLPEVASNLKWNLKLASGTYQIKDRQTLADLARSRTKKSKWSNNA